MTEGGAVTISSKTLQVIDPAHTNAPVTYTITALPADGELLLSGIPATVGTTFTQSDINLGHVRYQNNGSETVADSFEFTAADSYGDTLAPTTVAITVRLVNHAPTLNGNGTALTSIPENVQQPAGDLVSAIVGDTITDPDPGALAGIAVIGATGGHGTWQYSANGGVTWIAFGAVSASQALLLPDTDRVRFVPAANFYGVVSLVYRAWDRTTGVAGGRANLSSSASVGGSTAFSTATATASLTVLMNHAPTLNGNGTALTPVPEGTQQPAGDLVSAIVGGTITDPDPGALAGIAVIGATGGGGTWQYSANGGVTWVAFGAVSASQALLLPGTDRVRFVPAGYFNGVVSLVYRAWDRTTGVAGGRANLSSSASVGGSTAFSTATATASLTVTPVNHAPTLVANSVSVVSGSQWGTTVSALLAAAGAHDVDVPAVFGLAVTATTGAGWQYSTDGGKTWLDLGVVAASQVLLLDGAAWLRRLPGSTGPATLTFRAWDGTEGVAGETDDLSAADSVGGSTAFSLVSVKAVLKS